ncbi:MAG: hypothetical protein GXP29_08660 [Planctomycetes bacterium]|nr:hypothetical protein [Planctomycetota bacterium]
MSLGTHGGTLGVSKWGLDLMAFVEFMAAKLERASRNLAASFRITKPTHATHKLIDGVILAKRSANFLLLPVVVFLIFAMSCSNPTPQNGDGVIDNGANSANVNDLSGGGLDLSGGDNDIFVIDPVAERLVALRGVNHGNSEYTREVPNDQIVLMFDMGVSHTEAEGTIRQMQTDVADLGLALVGQIPDVGIYQFTIGNDETDADSAMARLDCEILINLRQASCENPEPVH